MYSSDFQEMSLLRLREAKLLLRHRYYAGAYYLAGYVIECALKACIAAKTKPATFPPKPEIVREYYRHDLAGLVRTAGLQIVLESRCLSAAEFEENWTAVKGWTEQGRYETNVDSKKAKRLLEAVSNPKNGVLKWLKSYW